MTFVARALLNEASAASAAVQSGELETQLQSALEKNPNLAKLWHWISLQADFKGSMDQLAATAAKWTSKVVSGSFSGAFSLLIAFFLLFYFLRDRDEVTGFVRSLLPLSNREANQVFGRVRDTVFASVYGTLSVAAVQGTLGGLMFWWLGLPGPLLWGLVMGLLAIIPVLGAFVIWIPAAVFLATQGSWGKAVILTVWGTVVIGLIDNLLYPIFVGQRLRLHTALVFIAIVGGLILFGASGLILGPVILALTDAAVEVWRCRTAR
jgi:predicted PurR-regulated permease PerM